MLDTYYGARVLPFHGTSIVLRMLSKTSGKRKQNNLLFVHNYYVDVRLLTHVYNIQYLLFVPTFSSASAIVLAYPLAQSKDYYNSSVNISMHYQPNLRIHKKFFFSTTMLLFNTYSNGTYGASYKKGNTLRSSYGYGCSTRCERACYGYRYGRCISHIVQPKSKQDGGICSARQFKMSVRSGIDVDLTEKRKV